MMMRIDGPLTFDTVAKWQRTVFAYMDSLSVDGGDLTLDFQSVTAVNSAALALMVEVLRRARAENVSLTFLHIPEKLGSLAKVSSLGEILGLP